MSQLGIQKGQLKYAYSKKSTGVDCIKCGIFLYLFAWWVWKYINGCNIIQIQTLGVVTPFNHRTGFKVAPSGD